MKYMGSKAKYAKHILPIILANRTAEQWYVEPFCGGCNCIDKVPGPRWANDVNPCLIALFRALADGWTPPRITREEYQNIRDRREDYAPELVGWAGVGCSYSGKWFGGYAGVVQTREGVRDYVGEAIANATRQAASLRGVRFTSGAYDQMVIPPNSVIYCDPPYAGTTSYETDFDHAVFWKWTRALAALGHQVFISEYAAPPEFVCVWEGRASSSLSANGRGGGNKTSVERLFVPPEMRRASIACA